jgi:hypothetical protein
MEDLTMTRLITTSTGVLCLLFTAGAMAGDGAIEIWEPTTITESGSYVVTRDITALLTIITITADNVDVDLNGFTLNTDTITHAAIHISAPAKNVTIENGTVVGGGGIYAEWGVERLTVRRLNVQGTNGHAITAGVSHESVFEDNVITARLIGISSDFNKSVIRRNTITSSESGGILVTGDGNLIVDNLIEDCAEDGIHLNVYANHNHITGNLLINNGLYGLVIHGGDNVYRGNVARGNSGTLCGGGNSDFCNNAGGNSSAGDNFMPDQM